jgi:hypothetical protein
MSKVRAARGENGLLRGDGASKYRSYVASVDCHLGLEVPRVRGIDAGEYALY